MNVVRFAGEILFCRLSFQKNTLFGVERLGFVSFVRGQRILGFCLLTRTGFSLDDFLLGQRALGSF